MNTGLSNTRQIFVWFSEGHLASYFLLGIQMSHKASPFDTKIFYFMYKTD
jgi:hypothetical protein